MTTHDWATNIGYLNKSFVHIKDKAQVNQILDGLFQGGSSRLQTVFDFDYTITKQILDGAEQLTSFSIFAKCESLPTDFAARDRELYKKYRPYENNANISEDERKRYMIQWWEGAEGLLKGIKFNITDIDDAVDSVAPKLRDGCKDAFHLMKNKNIPALIFSAGNGNIVESVLKKYDLMEHENVYIKSNFFKYDNDGTLLGFNGDLIHMYSKNVSALKSDVYYDVLAKRDCVILMGDAIGDAKMADGGSAKTILKIGFLSDVKRLHQYMDAFDIVLVNDQTMDLLNIILKIIID